MAYSIDIKKSHQGKFTDWAKSNGFASVAEAANHVMANTAKYSPAVVKMANFAKNARGFSHAKSSPSPMSSLHKLMGK